MKDDYRFETVVGRELMRIKLRHYFAFLVKPWDQNSRSHRDVKRVRPLPHRDRDPFVASIEPFRRDAAVFITQDQAQKRRDRDSIVRNGRTVNFRSV